MTFLLIGCGNLGQIILKGFVLKKKKIIVFEKDDEKVKKIRSKFSNVKFLSSLNEANWKNLKFIMLCVKPIDSKRILNEVGTFCLPEHIIISFVAGLKTNVISKVIKSKPYILRMMPNVFISSSRSATAVFSKNLNIKKKDEIESNFNHFGILVWLKQEKKMDFFTAMFGGGPAYFLYILECFYKLVKKNGFNKDQSINLLISLLDGVLVNIKQGDVDFAKSIKKVASKGGTTQEALSVLSRNDNLYNIFEKAIYAAESKSKKISQMIK